MTTKAPDWEAIESVFRAGSLSIRAIADKLGVSEGAIRKKAKKEGWMRDLTDKVKAATKTKLVRTHGTQVRTTRTDDEIVEDAASEAAAVVLAHRTDLAQWRRIATKLCDALDGIEVTEDNHNEFARSLNAGVDAQLKVIKGERQAYNLDTEEGDKTINELSSLMDDLSTEA